MGPIILRYGLGLCLDITEGRIFCVLALLVFLCVLGDDLGTLGVVCGTFVVVIGLVDAPEKFNSTFPNC